MKKLLILLALGVIASGSSMAQGTGGPDAYGYTYRDNTSPAGPVYNWVDISTRGTRVGGIGDDNSVGPFQLGFTFKYYWTDVRKFWIGSNGYIIFERTADISSGASGFPTIPTADGKDNFIAPLLADLNHTQDAGGATNPARVYYYTNNVDSAVVTYENVPFWTSSNPNGYQGANTFQIILTKNDKGILFQYKTQTGTWNSSYDQTANPLVVGIENVTGNVGLQVSNNQLPTAPRALKFYYPATTTYQVTDASANWIQNDLNRGFFVVTGQPTNISTNINNVGNTNIANAISVSTKIQKAAPTGLPTGAAIFTGTGSVNGLPAGQDTTITFGTQFTPPTEPTTPNPSHVLTTTLTLSGDQNPNNNTLTNEVVILDLTSSSNATLKYDDGAAENALGFEGGAVYFKPPVYPATIKSLEFFIVPANGVTNAASGYTAKILNDAGANGSPGATLFTQTMQPADVVLNSYNNIVTLPTPVVITSGGFYVAWINTGGSAQDNYLGTDTNGPFSHQAYEVQAGTSFGVYRSSDIEDLMIRANVEMTATSTPAELSSALSVEQSRPNPAQTQTTISYTLAKNADVALQITNLTGQVVQRTALGNQSAGSYSVNVSTANLASGVYFYTLTAGNEQQTRKMVVNR